MSRWPGVLRRITLPLIAPAILFAAVLVFLLTLGEVGVPTYLRYPVYPVETLTQFAAFYDFSAATAAAIPLLLVTLAILALEYRMLHKQVSELRTVTFGGRAYANQARTLALPASWHRFRLGRCDRSAATRRVDRPIIVVERLRRSIRAGEREHPTQPRLRGGRSKLADAAWLLLRLPHPQSNAADMARRRCPDAVSVYAARNRHRHRSHQPVEHADEQLHLSHAGDHHSWISRSIRCASDTDDVCNSGPNSAFIGTGRATLRCQLVHDAAAYRGAVGADVA